LKIEGGGGKGDGVWDIVNFGRGNRAKLPCKTGWGTKKGWGGKKPKETTKKKGGNPFGRSTKNIRKAVQLH